jgi:hypothetical protein
MQQQAIQKSRIAPIRLQHALRIAHEEATKRIISEELPTLTTDAIKTIHTGPLIVEPPAQQIIPICYVHAVIMDLTPFSRNIILSALRMVCRHRYIWWMKSTRYAVVEIYSDPDDAGRILAHVERA